jgi:hypothetical protein
MRSFGVILGLPVSRPPRLTGRGRVEVRYSPDDELYAGWKRPFVGRVGSP